MNPHSALVRRVTTLRRTPRGTAELSVGVVAVSLLAGLLFGSGLSRTSVDLADGLTWLADDPTGDVIQVNPATGRPEYRLDVGAKGDDLEITQYDGRMFVINHATGLLTSFDLSSILFSGRRTVSPGGGTAVLHQDGQVFLVDFASGSIAGIDPVTTDALGELWLSPEGLADATIDGRGIVWALDPRGLVTQLRWSPTSQSFVVEDTRTVDHSGPNSVLVGHEQGATVFGPDAGIVVQVGTGDDVVADAPELSGTLVAPDYSPAALAPVSSPETGSVILVGDRSVRQVDVRTIGCQRPDRPEVFEDVVYVPCPGDDRVVRLGPDGSRAAPDIATPPGGSPELVVDDGNLVINVPGSRAGLLVEGDGTVHDIVRYDPDVPATPVSSTEDPPDPPSIVDIEDIADEDDGREEEEDEEEQPSLPPTPVTSPGQQPDRCPPGRPGCTPGGAASGGPTPTPGDGGPSLGPFQAPRGVTASALPDGSLQVPWTHQGPDADSFVVSEVGGGNLATVNGRNRQAAVSVSPGPDHRFTVAAVKAGEPTQTSAPSGPVATSGRPGAPSGIGGSAIGSTTDDTVVVTITWTAAIDNGSPITQYNIAVTDATGSRTLTSTSPSVAFTTSCGDGLPYCDPGAISATVTAHNANGDGPSASGAVPFSGPYASPLPTAGAILVANNTHSWDGLQYDGLGTSVLNLVFPADWSSFTGTCSWVHTGNIGGATSGMVDCAATSLALPIDVGFTQDGATNPHTVRFTAENRNGSVQSAVYSWNTVQRACPRCEIP